MDNYILSYYQQIKDGTVVVGRWVDMVYTKLVNGIESGEYRYDAKKAKRVIDFIEKHCHHVEGKLAPKLLKLELWQKAMLSAIYGIVDETGNRQFREIYIVMARKQGKSLLTSALAQNAMFNDDEYGAKIYAVAPKLEQADIVYDAFWQSVQLDKELNAKTKHRKSDIYYAEKNASLKKIAFNAKKSDGFNPSLVIQDEVASFPAEQGLKVYEVMKSAMGARTQPLTISISTAGYIHDGVYDELLKRSTRFLLGNSKETRLLPFIYCIDDVDKWNDINELRKSNPNLGVSVSVDYLLEEIAIAEGSMSKKAEFLTKYCNIKQNSSMAWLSEQTVQKACGEHFELKDFRNHYAICGVDLSHTIDLTCVTTLIEKNGELYAIAHFFMPGAKVEENSVRDALPYQIYIARGLLTPSGENYVDYKDVYNYMVKLVEEYQILPLQVGYDRWSAQYLIQDLQTYGFQCDSVFQGTNLTGVIDETEGMLKDGKIHIGDNDLLKMHLLNSAMKTETESNKRKLIKVNSRLHIDGCASLLDGMCVRQKWYAELGDRLKNGGR